MSNLKSRVGADIMSPTLYKTCNSVKAGIAWQNEISDIKQDKRQALKNMSISLSSDYYWGLKNFLKAK